MSLENEPPESSNVPPSEEVYEGELVVETIDPSGLSEPLGDEPSVESTKSLENIHWVDIPMKKVSPSKDASVEVPGKPYSAPLSPPDSQKTPVEDGVEKENSTRTEDDEARARQRQKTFLLERRRQKKRQVLFGRLRVLLKLCFIVAMTLGLWQFATAPFWIYESPDFKVNDLHLLSRKNIESMVQPYTGQAIYQVDPKQIETILKKKYAIIERIDVRRQLFPGRLNLLITEKHPWGELYASASEVFPYAVVADDYEPIRLKDYKSAATFYPDRALPKVILPIQRLTTEGKDYLQRLNEVSYQLAQVPGLTLKYIDASDPKAVDAYFSHVRVRLGRLDATRSERLGRLFGLVGEITKHQNKIDDVDLRWLNQVTFHRGKYKLAKPYQGKKEDNQQKNKKEGSKVNGR